MSLIHVVLNLSGVFTIFFFLAAIFLSLDFSDKRSESLIHSLQSINLSLFSFLIFLFSVGFGLAVDAI